MYLWGGVGRGKTWLMDLFFDELGSVARRRRHFHQLMREVHGGLATIQQRSEPLQLLARRLARRANLWCLDELQVTDIADAMLLGGLFEELLAPGRDAGYHLERAARGSVSRRPAARAFPARDSAA